MPTIDLTRLPWRAIGSGLVVALLLVWAARLDHLRADWKSQFEVISGEADAVVLAVQGATGNPGVDWKTAKIQIMALGESHRQLGAAVARQNIAIDAMAQEAVRLKAKASELAELARKAEAQRAAALRRLDDLAAPPAVKRDCEQLVREADAALDLLYEEGF